MDRHAASVSYAYAGVGTSDPHSVTKLSSKGFTDEDTLVGTQWSGGEYSEAAWITCVKTDMVNTEEKWDVDVDGRPPSHPPDDSDK